MEQSRERTESAKPGSPVESPRPGQSGEGSRSAMEQLIQQERRRNAHQSREDERRGRPPAP
jgi:hypothetical protein